MAAVPKQGRIVDLRQLKAVIQIPEHVVSEVEVETGRITSLRCASASTDLDGVVGVLGGSAVFIREGFKRGIAAFVGPAEGFLVGIAH
jgi:hypothetical protein